MTGSFDITDSHVTLRIVKKKGNAEMTPGCPTGHSESNRMLNMSERRYLAQKKVSFKFSKQTDADLITCAF